MNCGCSESSAVMQRTIPTDYVHLYKHIVRKRQIHAFFQHRFLATNQFLNHYKACAIHNPRKYATHLILLLVSVSANQFDASAICQVWAGEGERWFSSLLRPFHVTLLLDTGCGYLLYCYQISFIDCADQKDQSLLALFGTHYVPYLLELHSSLQRNVFFYCIHGNNLQQGQMSKQTVQLCPHFLPLPLNEFLSK